MQTTTDLCDLRAAGAQEENISHERILFWRVLLQNFLTACKAVPCAWCPGFPVGSSSQPSLSSSVPLKDRRVRETPPSGPADGAVGRAGLSASWAMALVFQMAPFCPPVTLSQLPLCSHTHSHTRLTIISLASLLCPPPPAAPAAWGLVKLNMYPAEQFSVPHTRRTRT